MRYSNKPGLTSLVMGLALFAGGIHSVMAAGTASGTDINNTATLNYNVGAVAQTAILSSPDGLTPGGVATTFRVDNKVDLTVTSEDAATITVAPGSLNRVLEFTVTNTGNTTQGYILEAVADAGNNIPMASVRIYLDDGDTAGSWDANDSLYTASTNAGDLDPNTATPGDAVMTVFIVSNTPLTPSNGAVDTFSLLATTTDAGTATVTVDSAVNTATGVEVVFADASGTATGDAANDGTHSASGSYTVNTAALSIAKTAVVDDGLGGAYAIPGATITYSVVVTNTGAEANTIVISDPIPANTTYVLNSLVAAGGTLAYSINNGAAFVATQPADPATVTNVRATFATLADGSTTATTATMTFDVTID